MKKHPYEIQTFLSVGDFPKIITKAYAIDAIEIIDDKLRALKIESLKASGMYADKIQKEIEKFQGFKKFIGDKLSDIYTEEFQKLTGKKPQSTTKKETKKETKETKEVKPKRTRKSKKDTKKSIIDEVKDIFSENTGEIE